MKHELKEPFTKDKLKALRAGDTVLLTGTIYAARDAAHRKLIELIEHPRTALLDRIIVPGELLPGESVKKLV